MANPRNRLLPLFTTLAFTFSIALTPFAHGDETGEAPLAPPATADVANEGVPPAPAPDTAGSLDSEPAAEEAPVKKVKKKKKAKKEKKHGKKKGHKKNGGKKKHSKKKHKKYTD